MNEWDIKSFDFPLTPNSIVMELGGFNGRWCSEIARRYNPRLYVYEPQLWAYHNLIELLDGYNARVTNVGLGTQYAQLPMGEYGTDGCSFLPAGRVQDMGWMREWYAELEALHLTHIDLLLINIEGYEFVLLPHIMPWLTNVKWLMVQFHLQAGGKDWTGEYHAIREQLSTTHNILWDYGPVLVCWEVK